jgi:hypothetical protein
MSYILYSVLILILFFGLFQDTVEHLSKGVLEGETKEEAMRRFREEGYTGDIDKIGNTWYGKSKWEKTSGVMNRFRGAWMNLRRKESDDDVYGQEFKKHQKSSSSLPREGAIRGLLLPKRITKTTNGVVTKKNSTKNIMFMIILCLLILVIIVIVTIIFIKKFKMKEI